MSKYLRSISFVSFEGDDDAAAAEAAKKAAAAEKKFSQDDVNAIMKREKVKSQETERQLVAKLQQEQKNAQLTAEEKETLAAQIDELQGKYLSAEELARQASDKATKENEEKLEALESDRNAWRGRYDRARIATEITTASSEHKAIRSSQIAAILNPMTKVEEVLDDVGKGTGSFVPKVSFKTVDKEDKPITLEIGVPEAVKRMKEMDEYANLFEGGKSGGLGAGGGKGSAGKIDIVKIASEDPGLYRKLRKEKPELFANL